MKKKFLTLFLGASLIAAPSLFYSCESHDNNGGEENTTQDTSSAMQAPAEQAPEQSATAQNGDITLHTVGNTMSDMKFDQTELHVAAGSSVHLTLQNQATDEAMQHNWVLIDKSANVDEVAMAGLKAGKDNEFVPKDDARVLAHTKVLGPGGSTDITFTAPAEKGEYPFICSYPGHYKMMNGKLIVE